jgi:hypothetical protein
MPTQRLVLAAFAAYTVVTTGCTSAPRNIELELTFSPEQVQLQALLKDVRGFQPDALNQLRAFAFVATPRDEWFKDLPWMPRPSVYAWKARADAIDLEIRVAMPRAKFDACARDACDKEPGPACAHFPIRLCGDAYAVDPEVLDEDDVRVLEGTTRTWSAKAAAAKARLEVLDGVARNGPSLRPGMALFQSNPDTARALASFDADVTADVGARPEAAGKLLQSAPACKDGSPLCELRREILRRRQAALLHAYLKRHDAWELAPPPEEPFVLSNTPSAQLVPKQPLLELQSLKLRVLYEVAQRGFAQTGQLKDISAQLQEVCTRRGWKPSKDQGTFCGALTLKLPE